MGKKIALELMKYVPGIDYNKLQTKSNYTYIQLTTKITVIDEVTL